ncbi:4-hydroxybutyrate coenzyme A transferase [Labilithrix luteola]|uniref:4-hydroxybutyrate coenzyme A transferase n=1 Tax=Labilithrix luteola TaxID=1391654 RepID=A0A0K1PL10_9BACT|nr:acetyl-CoA hydrolase/transferase C-terminal domain-containing protein [Labilithrix luteola]AKU93804.1 4-hydroxybutyrate coenzyme A transferase [Labilithrix luteola]
MQLCKTPTEVVQHIHSHQRVFVHGSAATPSTLLAALLDRGGEITGVELVAISTFGAIDWNRAKVREHFFMNSLFVSANVREWVDTKDGDYVPVFLSEIPALFRKGAMPIDVALLQVSPPDKHGYCSLGTSIDAALAAAYSADVVLAQINPKMPRTHGDGHIHTSRITAAIELDTDLPEVRYGAEADERTEKIGRYVAELIEDGSTLQMGIGAIPDAVLRHLGSHKGLGIHTEMFSDGVIPLVEKGVVTNEFKKVEPGKILTTFVIGTRKVYDFVDDNPIVSFRDVSMVNDTAVIRKNPKVVAINSALQLDLTGQVCADSLGTYQFSGIGGQMDFMRGASLSEGGKPIIAMPSVTKKGISRIVGTLADGAGVVTTRGHVHWVVTEYGVANLYGKGLQERAKGLIQIAAPEHREGLERQFYQRFTRGS